MNKLSLLTVFLLIIWRVDAQMVVTVVDGSLSDHDHVFEEYYNYSHVQYLYDKTLIGQSGTITALQFEHTNNSSTSNNITIYMGNTSKSSFTGSSDWISSGMTIVYTGSITTSNGWYTVPVNFYYDNTYNLAIIIDNDDGSYTGTSSHAHYYGTTASYTMLRDRASSDVGDYGTISSFGTRQMELASLKLTFLNTTACSGTPSGGTAQASITSGCAVFTTALTVTPSPSEADLTFQWQESSDGVSFTDIPGATTQSYNASVASTTYYRRAVTCTNSGETGYSSSVLVVADCYNMSTGTVNTCSGHFYDSGGASSNYGNSLDQTMTFCSSNPGEYISFVFSSFYTGSGDYLEVYDGPNTSSPLIFSLSGEAAGADMPPDIISTNDCITFRFISDASVNHPGWDAIISCTTEPNTVAHDYCEGATQICRLNGYTGKTSSFYNKDFPGNMCDIDEGPQPCDLFLGNINNNSWISFTASETSATFDVTVANCSQNQGIQMGIYSGTACDNFELLSDPALTSGVTGVPTALPNNSTTTVSAPFGSAPALIPGQTYYIMIDGQSGDVCDYSIVATSGVAQASINFSDTTICSGADLSIIATGGDNYLWSVTPAVTDSVINLNPTSSDTYTVTISGGNTGCPDVTEFSAAVYVNPLPAGNTTPVTQTICSGQSVSDILLSADIPGTIFSWTRTNPSGISTSIPLSGSGVPSGSVIAGAVITNSGTSPLVIDFNIIPLAPTGCEGDIITAMITVNPLPAATVTDFTNPSGCSASDGSISVTSNPLYNYQWNTSPVQTTATATGLPSGGYLVTVTQGNCQITLSQSLNDPGAPSVSLTVDDNTICEGETVTFTASGITSGTYEFFVDGTSVQGPSTNAVYAETSITDGQMVSVTGMEAGCQGTATAITVTVTPIPEAFPSIPNQNVCSGNQSEDIIVVVDVSGGQFDWTADIPTGITTSLPPSGSGIPSGGIIYSADFINNTSSPLTITFNITPYVNAGSECTGETVSSIITIFPLPVPDTLILSDVTVCTEPWNGAAQITVTTGAVPLQYSMDGNPATASSSFYGLSGGVHYLTIEDAQGCNSDTSFTLGFNTGVEIDSVFTTHVSCNGNNDGIIIIYSGDAALYQVDGFAVQPDSIFTGIAPGEYLIHIWDNGNCEATQTVIINEPDSLENDLWITQAVSCHGVNEGTITTTTTGGASPYYYIWNDPSGSVTSSITELSGNTTYSITITDANNCSMTNSIFLSEPDTISNFISITNISCNGGDDGIAVANADGGISPYNYLWSDSSGTTNDTVINLLPDTYYYISITDNNGCLFIDSTILSQPPSLAYTMKPEAVLCYGDNSGSAEIQVSGGTPPYSYLWNDSGSSTTASADSLYAGTIYSVTVTDSNGCSFVENVELSEPGALADSIGTTDVTCKDESDGTINLTVSGGTGPYGYLWSNGEAVSNPDDLSAGVYTFTVTDSNNCIITDTVYIDEPDSLIISGVVGGGTGGSINIEIEGGTQDYNYLWSNGTNTQDLSNLESGQYSVTVTDANGCSISSTYDVLADLFIPNAISPNGDGVNDEFEILNIGMYNQVSVEIFNRWGEQLFYFKGTGIEYADIENCWDGTWNGKDLPFGSYLYIVLIDNLEPFTGVVVIKR